MATPTLQRHKNGPGRADFGQYRASGIGQFLPIMPECLYDEPMKRSLGSSILAALLFTGCSSKLDIPLEYPTPPPPVQATPAPPISFKRESDLESQFALIAKEAN